MLRGLVFNMMIDHDNTEHDDPDATVETFAARWLQRFFPNDLAAVVNETDSDDALAVRLQKLFCKKVVAVMGAEHHAECDDNPEKWLDLLAANLLLAGESALTPRESLIGLLADQLTELNWQQVANMVQAPKEANEPTPTPPAPKRLRSRPKRPIVGVDPITGERVEFATM